MSLFRRVLLLVLPLLWFVVASGCGGSAKDRSSDVPRKIQESAFTPYNVDWNIDSVAVWDAPSGKSILIATSKEQHQLFLFDALNGQLLSAKGKKGKEPGELLRPNGIFVRNDIVFVVERDNHRVSIFSLPDFRFLGIVGEDVLINPYGIYVEGVDRHYVLYVTDDVGNAPEEDDEPAGGAAKRMGGRMRNFLAQQEGEVVDNTAELPQQDMRNRKVKRITLELDRFVAGNVPNISITAVSSFGDAEGEGALSKVESIYGDRHNNRLLIADEGQKNIKVYDMNGLFTGTILGDGLFTNDPEGIALVEMKRGRGYWVFADQDKTHTRFLVFDRTTLEHKGTFEGDRTANTDGVAFSGYALPGYYDGRFYAVHNDGGIALFDWKRVQTALNLNRSI